MNESVASAVSRMRDLLPQRSDYAAMRRNPKRDVIAGLTVAMTCGTGEENLTNNRRLHRRLVGAGVPVTLAENPDGHSYVGWRDCLDPALATLLRRVWTGRGPRSPER